MKVWAVVFVASWSLAGTDLVPRNIPPFPEGPNDIDNLFRRLLARQPLESHETDFLAMITSIANKEATAVYCAAIGGCPIDFECIRCRMLFRTIFNLVNLGWSDARLTTVGEWLCVSFSAYTAAVCNGIIRLNVQILTFIIRNTPEATPSTFCHMLLQDRVDPHKCPLNDRRFEWQVQLPQYQRSRKRSLVYTKPLKIALITDAHIDPLYEPGGVADCDEPVCCRQGQRPKSRKPSAPAGYWGDYRNCDMPTWTYDNVIDEIDDKHEIDVLYYIGDTIDHHIWETSYELVQQSHRRVVNKIKRTFGDQVLAFMAIGNHESQPTNQFAPSYITDPILNTTWLYNSLADKWGEYLDMEAVKSLRETGGYSMLVRPGFRIISLNNNIAYRMNLWLVYDPLECKRHLEWLVARLYEAEVAGEIVHILGHIPPGMEDFIYTWTREYNRIVNRFKSTIAAEFNGHTHEDGFKIFFDPHAPTFATNMAWNGGGITTFNDYNLNYKILTVDPNNYQLTDMRNYVFNLTEANLSPGYPPNWFKLYDWRRDFGLADLSAPSMVYLVYRMVTTERDLLDKYASFTSKISDIRWPACDDQCKIEELCETVTTVLWEREKCAELKNKFYNIVYT